MQVSGRVNQPVPVKAKESTTDTQRQNRKPYSGCKQHLPKLRLRSFLKHCYQCKGDISQREVSCPPPVRDTNSRLKIKIKSCSSFRRVHSLRSYAGIHTDKRNPFRFESCYVANNDHLIRHQHILPRDRPYGCNQCDEHFRRPVELKIHQRCHTGEKPQGCNKRFVDMTRPLCADPRTVVIPANETVAKDPEKKGDASELLI